MIWAQRIRGLSPLGPIFSKELRTTSRRKRTYLLRFCYLGVLLGGLLVVYYAATEGRRFGNEGAGVARRAQQLAEMGSAFFGLFIMFTLFAMGLIGPVLTATAVSGERLHKTLAVLVMTPITAWQIAAGKLFSRLLIALTLIALSLPVLAVSRLLGGVEASQMFAGLALCVAVAVSSAALGLLLSVLINRAFAVILLSYAVQGTAYILIWLLWAMAMAAANNRGPGFRSQMFFWMSRLNPFFTGALLAFPGGPATADGWVWCVVVQFAAAALMLIATALLIRRAARRENEGSGRPVAPQASAKPVAMLAPPPVPDAAQPSDPATPPPIPPPVPAALAYATNAPRARIREVSDNPVLWRETRRPMLRRVWQRVLVCLFVLGTLTLIYILMAANNGFSDRDGQSVFAVIFCGLLTVVASILSATAIAQEKESDTWTLLLATPLPARRIVLGKLVGMLRRLIWPAALILAHFALFVLSGVLHPWTALIVLWLIFTTNILWVATGVYLSLRVKAVTTAVVLNLLIPVVLYLGVLMAAIPVGYALTGREQVAIVGVYSPYEYIVVAIERHGRRDPFTYNATVRVEFFGSMSNNEFGLCVAIVGIAYLLATAGVVYWTIFRFDALVARARQTQIAHRPGFEPRLA